DGIRVTGVSLTEDADVGSVTCPLGACTAGSQREPAPEGSVFTVTAQVRIPKPTTALYDYLNKIDQQRLLVWWTDYNGQSRLAGEPDNGLRLTWTDAQSEANAIVISLSGRFTHAPYYILDGDDIFTAFTDEFSYDF
ncbi:hypothetical protein, partial [Arsenicibacter rosenii]|uniref:hypothetical protein n=1 Tax=Arsenicibacter rosenii TaxID=1750698 RepID=UPI0015A703C7